MTYGDNNVLELIGARNTSVFLVNKTIWVEGITDRLYIKKYLDLYIEENNLIRLREDVDYSFVEYGGDNITHWSFLDAKVPTINVERLCGTLFLVTDRDSNRKEARKRELAQKLGDRYYLLPCEEIENTLSLKTLEKVLKTYEKEFEMPANVSNTNRLSRPIGEFIEKDIFADNSISIKRKGGYKSDSGSIKQKLAFCQRAIKNMDYTELSNTSIALADKVYKFLSS